MNPFRRRRPTANQIIDHAIERQDFRTAALFTIAGCLEVLDELQTVQAAATEEQKRYTLVRALAPAPVT